MCTDRLKKDGFGTVVLDKLEHDAQIVAHAARPSPGQVSLELVRLELRMKRIIGELLQRRLQDIRHVG